MKFGARGGIVALVVAVPVAVGAAVLGFGYENLVAMLVGGEEAEIAASHGLVTRDGRVLTLALEGGAALALTDRLVCGDLPCPAHGITQYRYRGWNDRAGGYRLLIGLDHPAEATLVWALAGGDPALLDANDLLLRANQGMAMPARPRPAKTDPALLDWLKDIAGRQDAVEGPRIAKAGGKVARDGATLAIALADGRKLALVDDVLCGQLICPPEIYISYEYRGADPTERFHAIEEHFYETGDAFLLDAKSGGVTQVAGPVTFSPDGARAVATMNDPQPHGQHDIEIWSLTGAAPLLEYCFVGEGENTYETKEWKDPQRIVFTRGKWQSDAREVMTLNHDAAGWHAPAANCL